MEATLLSPPNPLPAEAFAIGRFLRRVKAETCSKSTL